MIKSFLCLILSLSCVFSPVHSMPLGVNGTNTINTVNMEKVAAEDGPGIGGFFQNLRSRVKFRNVMASLITFTVGFGIAFQIATQPVMATTEMYQPKLKTEVYQAEQRTKVEIKDITSNLEFNLGRRAYRFDFKDGRTPIRIYARGNQYFVEHLSASKNTVTTTDTYTSANDLKAAIVDDFPDIPLTQKAVPFVFIGTRYLAWGAGLSIIVMNVLIMLGVNPSELENAESEHMEPEE